MKEGEARIGAMELFRLRIKKKFKTKKKYCEALGIAEQSYKHKEKTLSNSIERVNKILKPLGLKVLIVGD